MNHQRSGNKLWKKIIERIVIFFLVVAMMVTSTPYFNYKLEAATATVKIVGFTCKESEGMRVGELLEARVSGYKGNVHELTYTWTNNTDSYLYVYNSHNMYGIHNTSEEIRIAYNDQRDKNTKTSGGGKDYAWASVSGSFYSDVVSGNVTVTVTDNTGSVVATATYTQGFEKADLQKELESATLGIFEGDRISVKRLIAQSGLLHLDCSACEAKAGQIAIEYSSYANVESSEDGDYVCGLKKGIAYVGVSLQKNNCRFHEGQTGSASVPVYVFQRPEVAVDEDSITLSNTDESCTYLIKGEEGEKVNGAIVFKGLEPNSSYTIEVATPYEYEGQIAYAYTYLTETTDPLYKGVVQIGHENQSDVSAAYVADQCPQGIYLKEQQDSRYIPVTLEEDGRYSASLRNGIYEIYGKKNGTFALLDEQRLVIAGNNSSVILRGESLIQTETIRQSGTVTGNIIMHYDYQKNGSTVTLDGQNRPAEVMAVLQRKVSENEYDTIDASCVILQEDSSDGRPVGVGSYQFEHELRFEQEYRVQVLAPNYQASYSTSDGAALWDSSANASVDVELTYEPETFVLEYQIDASLVDKDNMPAYLNLQVLSADSMLEDQPLEWNVADCDSATGSVITTIGESTQKGIGGIPVYRTVADGSRAYNYAVKVCGYSLHGKYTEYDAQNAPFEIIYSGPTRYDTYEGQQKQPLSVTLVPKEYKVTFHVDADSDEVSGMEDYAVSLGKGNYQFTRQWGQYRDISAIRPARTGYVFQGWKNQEDGSMVTGIKGDLDRDVELEAVWEVDQIGNGMDQSDLTGKSSDGVADKFQKKLTYKVVHGTWSDGSSEDIVKVVSLADSQGNLSVDGTAGVTVPSSMKASTGFCDGKWEKIPPAIVRGTENETYTFSFSKDADSLYTVEYRDNAELSRDTLVGYKVEYYYDGVLQEEQTEHLSAKYQSVIGSYPMKKTEGYALDYTENLPLTITAAEADNVIRIYYGKDQIGKSGKCDASDNIPDRYQVKVTFSVENGTWSSDEKDKEPIVKVATLKNETGAFALPGQGEATVIVPTGMVTKKYCTQGGWNQEIGAAVTVTDHASYVYSFGDAVYYVEHYKEILNEDGSSSYVLVRGSKQYGLAGSLAKVEQIPSYTNYHLNQEKSITSGVVQKADNILILKLFYDLNEHSVSFNPDGGNGLDVSSVIVKHGTRIQLPQAPVREQYVFAGWGEGAKCYQPGEELEINADCNWKALWEEDFVGGGADGTAPDGIPDKCQKRVVFRIVNGSWSKNPDNTADIVVYASLQRENQYEVNGSAEIAVPTGMRPLNGFHEGSWDNTPLTTVRGTGETVYTYTFKPRNDLEYTVNFLEKGTNKVLSPAVQVNNCTFGEVIYCLNEIVDIAGYRYDSSSAETITISTEPKANELNLYYEKGNVPYQVECYFDGVLDESKTYTEYGVYQTKVSAICPENVDGYVVDQIEPLTLRLSSDAAQNIIRVYYCRDIIGKNGGIDGGDGIADKYQAKVVFKIANGIWEDASSSDIIKVVTLTNDGTEQGLPSQDGFAMITLPVGMMANKGLEGAASGWNKSQFDAQLETPQVVVQRDSLFRYSYGDVPYTVRYYRETSDIDDVNAVKVGEKYYLEDTFAASVNNGTAGSTVMVNGRNYPGYVLNASISELSGRLEKREDGQENIYHVYYDRAVYNVSYDLGGVSVLAGDTRYEPQSVSAESDIEVAEAPVRDGYVFAGWKSEKKSADSKDTDVKIIQAGERIPVRSDLMLTAIWEKDVIGNGTAGEPDDTGHSSDGIPDKYQKVITYKIKNGTWTAKSGDNQEVVFVATLRKKDKKGNILEDTYDVNGYADVSGRIPDSALFMAGYGYQTQGEWDVTPDREVCGNIPKTYTYIFQPENIPLLVYDAPIVEKSDGTMEESLTLQEEQPVSYGKMIKIDPQGGSFVYAGTRYNEFFNETSYYTFTIKKNKVLENAVKDGYVFAGWERTSGDGDYAYTFTAKWEEDKIGEGKDGRGDKIPDRYQKKLIYKVENGSWSANPDDNKAIVKIVTLRTNGKWNANGSATVDIPNQMTAAYGYTSGSWDVTPHTLVSGKDSVTYTFAYRMIDNPKVTYNEPKADAPDGELTGTYVGVPYGSKLQIQPNEGIWNQDGVNHTDDQTLTLTADIKIADPIRQNYIFTGWRKTADDKKNMCVLTAQWEEDVIVDPSLDMDSSTPGDGIPDKYQVKVTFVIRNGTWVDKSTDDIVKYVTMYDEKGLWSENGTAHVDLPRGMHSLDRYDDGSWNVDVTGSRVVVNDNTTFIYSYGDAEYIVQHYKQNVQGGYDLYEESHNHGKLGSTVTVEYTREYANYSYNAEKSKDTISGVIEEPDHKLVLKVFYDLVEHSVSYDLNGGTGKGFDPALVKHGASMRTVQNQPTRKGYVFGGWMTQEAIYGSGDNLTVDKDTVLCAIWDKDVLVDTSLTGQLKKGDGIADKYQVTVTYKIKNGFWADGKKDAITYVTTLKDPNGAYSESGTAVVPVPAGMQPKEGFADGGWSNTNEIPEGATEITVSDNRTYRYTYGGATYHVVYYAQNLDGTYQVLEDSVNHGNIGEQVSAEIHDYRNYNLNESKSNLEGVIDYESNKRLVLEVYYDLKQYQVQYDYNGADETELEPQQVKHGDRVIVRNNPQKSGSVFMGWSSGGAIYQPGAEITILKDYQFVALWEDDVIGTIDENAPSGQNGDGVPDIYQKIVVFRVQNGTWADETTADHTVVLTLENSKGERSSDGTSAINRPKNMKAFYGYGNGAWDMEPVSHLSGTEAVVYTYTFMKLPNPKVTYDIPTDNLRVVPGTGNVIQNQQITDENGFGDTIQVDPNGGIWHKDEVKYEVAQNITLEENIDIENPSREGYVFMGWKKTNLNRTSLMNASDNRNYALTAQWELDKVGMGPDGSMPDGIPDLFQKKITLHIKGGSWQDNTTNDIVIYVSLMKNSFLDVNGTATFVLPEGMKPKDGFGDGKWSKVVAEVSGTDDLDLTYEFILVSKEDQEPADDPKKKTEDQSGESPTEEKESEDEKEEDTSSDKEQSSEVKQSDDSKQKKKNTTKKKKNRNKKVDSVKTSDTKGTILYGAALVAGAWAVMVSKRFRKKKK